MTKVSKNIKKLRTEKGLTQEALGEKINVTRQAISSWENGRTQPDLEMLGLLADAFDVEMEQLIYGEKRKTQIENEPVKYRSTAIIAISVLGALLLGAGLSLIFWAYWQRLPTAVKGTFAVLPLVAGQAAAVYTFLKKQNSVPWRESAAIAWTAGLVATVALISNVFGLAYGYVNWLIIDAVLILPIVYLLDAVSPMVIYYYMIIHWSIAKIDDAWSIFRQITFYHQIIFYTVIAAIMIAAMAVFTAVKKKTLDEISQAYASWITAAACAVLVVWVGIALESFIYAVAFSCAVSFYALSKKDSSLFSPLYLLGILGILIMSAMFSFINGDGYYLDSVLSKPLTFSVFTAACIGPVVLSVLVSKKSFKKNIFKIAELSCLSAMLIVYLLSCVYVVINDLGEYGSARRSRMMIFFVTLRILVFVLGIIFILHGAKENKLLLINTGFLSICSLIAYFLFMSDTSLLVKGIILTLLGGTLIAIDVKIAKRKELVENAGTTTKGQVQQDEK